MMLIMMTKTIFTKNELTNYSLQVEVRCQRKNKPNTPARAGKRTRVQLPGVRKFCLWASENRSLLAHWESEINLSSVVSLNKNVIFQDS